MISLVDPREHPSCLRTPYGTLSRSRFREAINPTHLKSAKAGLRPGPSPQSRKIEEQTQTKPLGLTAYFSGGYIKIGANKAIEVNRFCFSGLARKRGRFCKNLDETGRLPNNECQRRFIVRHEVSLEGSGEPAGQRAGRAHRTGQEQFGIKLESPLQSGGKETRLAQPSMNWAANNRRGNTNGTGVPEFSRPDPLQVLCSYVLALEPPMPDSQIHLI
jgi:hypothetical protein